MYYVSEYKSIFLFLIPLLHAVNLECNLYASINLVWLKSALMPKRAKLGSYASSSW